MMIYDARGQSLEIAIGTAQDHFGGRSLALACSPADDGFTVLNGLIDGAFPRAALRAACEATIERKEVCILPLQANRSFRILLTPAIRVLGEEGRGAATTLMLDLFNASQTPSISATGILITHFQHVGHYPKDHLHGIFDALSGLRSSSFGNLAWVGFDLPLKWHARFVEEFYIHKGIDDEKHI